jgi:hypothetical protein
MYSIFYIGSSFFVLSPFQLSGRSPCSDTLDRLFSLDRYRVVSRHGIRGVVPDGVGRLLPESPHDGEPGHRGIPRTPAFSASKTMVAIPPAGAAATMAQNCLVAECKRPPGSVPEPLPLLGDADVRRLQHAGSKPVSRAETGFSFG